MSLLSLYSVQFKATIVSIPLIYFFNSLLIVSLLAPCTISTEVTIYEPCSDGKCSDPNAFCVSHGSSGSPFCKCNEGFHNVNYERVSSSYCVKPVPIGVRCSRSEECQFNDPHSTCVHSTSYSYPSICKCEQRYKPIFHQFDNKLFCIKPIAIGEKCSYTEECELYDSNSTCSLSTCECSYNFYNDGKCKYGKPTDGLMIFIYTMIGVIILLCIALVIYVICNRHEIAAEWDIIKRALNSNQTENQLTDSTTTSGPQQSSSNPTTDSIQNQPPLASTATMNELESRADHCLSHDANTIPMTPSEVNANYGQKSLTIDDQPPAYEEAV